MRHSLVRFLCFACLAFSLLAQQETGYVLLQGITYRAAVAGDKSWTDTIFYVVEGQEISFKATGGISLQRGNPIAFCDPDGYNLKTVQQPIREENIGALIGRVVQIISVQIDEETGEETRNERAKEFYIGKENRVRIPMSGRLFLGINEFLVADNAGEFRVEFYLETGELDPHTKGN